MTTGRKAPERGVVEDQIFEVSDIPRYQRVTTHHRESVIERTLVMVQNSYPEGTPVCIRQYSKKESAQGTLHNLRKRHGKPGEDGWDGWEFKVGPLDEFGHPGMVGLFVTYNPNGS